MRLSSSVMLTHKIYPLNSGDALYNWGIYNELKKISSIKIFSLTTTEIEIKTQGIIFYKITKGYNSISNQMVEDVCEYIDKYNVDIILVSHILMYKYFCRLKKKYPTKKIMYISHNVEYLNDIEQYENKLKMKRGIEKIVYNIYIKGKLFESRKREKSVLEKTSGYFSTSKTDIQLHQQIYHVNTRSYFLKPVISFPCNKEEIDLENYNKKILVVGSMSWYPNVNGIVWFVEKVMTQLMEENYKLFIVGNNPSDSILALSKQWPENIIVTGKVPAVDPYFEMCDISIVPLFEGTGTKIKVLESIGRGIPTIATGFAAKDYGLVDEISIADTAQEFIDTIHYLENNKSYRIKQYRKMKAYYAKYNQLDKEIYEIFK